MILSLIVLTTHVVYIILNFHPDHLESWFYIFLKSYGFKLKMPHFECQSAWRKKRDQPLKFISAPSLCLLSTRPLRENCPLIWLFCWENDPACRYNDSRLFSAVNDTKLTSSFVSSDCFCFHLKKIPIVFCGIPLVGFLIPFTFIQMGSLISFLTFNFPGLQTGGLC